VLPAWVVPRFERALEVAGEAWFVPLSAGTPYRPPPLDERGFPVFEARAGADYSVARGVDPRRILIEESSYDTLGNAFFSLVLHAIPRGFGRVLVITSLFHMARVEAVFRWVYGLGAPSCAVEYEAVADAGMDAEALRARAEKERASLAVFESVRARVGTFAELHRYMFTEHGVYSAVRKIADVPVDTRLY
jgi:hypothetical protein